jgi:hypothetical protein
MAPEDMIRDGNAKNPERGKQNSISTFHGLVKAVLTCIWGIGIKIFHCIPIV